MISRLTREQLLPFLGDIDALIAGGERMSPDLFALAPKLRVIARTGVGYDLIDVAAASCAQGRRDDHARAPTRTASPSKPGPCFWRCRGGSSTTIASFTAAAGTGRWSRRCAA